MVRYLVTGVVLALVLGASGHVAHGGNASTKTFLDTAGDSGTAADVGAVMVNVNTAQQVAVTVGLSGTIGVICLYLDVDDNAATGNPGLNGADWAIEYDSDDHAYSFTKWYGTTWGEIASHPSLSVRTTGTAMTFSINRSDLPGSSRFFNFWIGSYEAYDVFDAGHSDFAPDRGAYRYAFSPVELMLKSFTATSATGTLSLAAVVRRSDTGARVGTDATVTCKAKGLRLRSSLKTPVATCVFDVPKALRGTMAKGTLSVAVDGVILTRSFSAKLR